MHLTLDEFIKGETIAVVDIETTGFSHRKDCIVEIGVCELSLDSGKCRELFNKIVRNVQNAERLYIKIILNWLTKD